MVVIQAILDTRIANWNDFSFRVAAPISPEQDAPRSNDARNVPHNIKRTREHLEDMPVIVLQGRQDIEEDIENVHAQ